MEDQYQVTDLATLAQQFINEVVRQLPGVREGTVMTVGPAPYRRLDADGRALAYVRVRPRKQAVRVDISGLWRASAPTRLRVASAGGSATLLLRSTRDLLDAVRFFGQVVEETRAANAANLLPRAA